MIRFVKKYFLSISVILLILILSFMSAEQLPESPEDNFDKVVHIFMYLGLSGIIFFDETNYFRHSISRKWIFYSILIFPITFGGIIELMQEYFTTTRTGDWFDFLFNVIGSFFGWVGALLINRFLYN